MALLTDERGFITEGTGNNYFIVKDGEYVQQHRLRYPPLSCSGSFRMPSDLQPSDMHLLAYADDVGSLRPAGRLWQGLHAAGP